jgi:acyl-CoA-dependent ceramide synthase
MISPFLVEPARYFTLEWDPAEGKCFSFYTQKIFVGLLVMLNIIMFYWFLLIVKVIVRLFTGSGADDPRSDDEDEKENQSDEFKRKSEIW